MHMTTHKCHDPVESDFAHLAESPKLFIGDAELTPIQSAATARQMNTQVLL